MTIGFLIFVLLILAVAGVLVWLIERSPFNPPIRWFMTAVVVVGALLVVLQRAGVA